MLKEWIEKVELPVEFKDAGEANGYYHLSSHFIAIHKDRSTLQQQLSLLYAKCAKFDWAKSRIREAQAEAVAYVVMNHFGYDTGEYSFGHIAGWSIVYSLALVVFEFIICKFRSDFIFSLRRCCCSCTFWLTRSKFPEVLILIIGA
ncbi:hypothetical protein GJU40_11635 [Bacillus lacus]|uniref:Uncharacterized protein n=1 Tax=Metabacillus lacus TaxID=1983721 RepID=A0A7X2IZR2_9BACI|nr:hypothetical protein [Metabacillus lacus]MRX72797.1 hypothetical protein [Metabacillus lacus]